jgi:hypothetical protein
MECNFCVVPGCSGVDCELKKEQNDISDAFNKYLQNLLKEILDESPIRLRQTRNF